MYRSERKFGSLIRGVGHLESTIVSAHRALEFLERLRRVGYRAKTALPLCPGPVTVKYFHKVSAID